MLVGVEEGEEEGVESELEVARKEALRVSLIPFTVHSFIDSSHK